MGKPEVSLSFKGEVLKSLFHVERKLSVRSLKKLYWDVGIDAGQYSHVTVMVLIAEMIHLQYLIIIITAVRTATLDDRWSLFITLISSKSALFEGGSVSLVFSTERERERERCRQD